MSGTALLSVRNLEVTYDVRGQLFRAVDGVSFDIGPGETVGLVGESGCGKSTLGKSLLRLIDSSAGSIAVNGEDIARHGHDAMQPYRRRMQMVFQDPFGSLNPRQTVRRLLDIPLRAHGVTKVDRQQRIAEILKKVGLPPSALDRFPHEFSGGQRQRLGIARALILKPELLICDEPVSALDVSIQSQILNLLVDLKSELGLAYLFISHDLSVVRYFADRVLVMYLGRVVETADYRKLWRDPRHPYTRALLAAVPISHPGVARGTDRIAGEIQTGTAPGGCGFYGRCPRAQVRCAHEIPLLHSFSAGHFVACHFPAA